MVDVEAVTIARTAPKKTVLFAAIRSKLDPLIITVVPTGPDNGENELITGVCPIALLKMG